MSRLEVLTRDLVCLSVTCVSFPFVWIGATDTGKWRPTPPALMPALTPQWAHLKTWVRAHRKETLGMTHIDRRR